MDEKRAARTPRAGARNAVNGGESGCCSEKAARWGWRAPVEVAVVGFVATLTLLVLLYGGTGSLLSFTSPRTEFVRKLAGNRYSTNHVWNCNCILELSIGKCIYAVRD
jgi:cytochrome c-type biogenesis protein CcmH/NrfG